MSVSIRTARPQDHPRIVRVVDGWWGGRRMAALLPRLFLEHFAGTSLVADDESGELAGFLVGFRSPDHPDEAYVHFVGVRPDQRGTGLGRALHDRFAAQVAPYGVTRVRCVTSTVNEASVRFHTSIGFSVDGQDAPVTVDGIDDVAGHILMSRPVAVTDPAWLPLTDPRPDDTEWPQAAWPVDPDTRLVGRYVELSVSDPDADAIALFDALDHDQVWAHVAGRPSDVEAMAALVEGKLSDPAWCPWTVRLRVPLGSLPTGTVVGTTSYLEVAPRDARGEIGSTTYDPAVWGTAVNPECKLLLLRFAFQQLQWGRLQLKTDIRNARSQRAIARLGATYEGTLRRYQRRADATVRDTVLYSVTAEQWPAVAARLADRLSAYEDPA